MIRASRRARLTGSQAELTDWILRTGRHLPDVSEFAGAFGDCLTRMGMPVWRIYFGLRQLHPTYLGRAIVWDRATRSVATKPRRHGIEGTDYYRGNPASAIFERGEWIRQRLSGQDDLSAYPSLEEIRREGGTDYLAVPLDFHAHRHQVAAFTSDAPTGFEWRHVELIFAILPSLATVLENFNEREDSRRVLAVYIGERASERVLNGAIRRGRCETVRAVLWLCDLENFTGLSEVLTAPDLVSFLDSYHDAIVSAVERRGGEVLKFMGDSALAIFEIQEGADEGTVCHEACRAARDAVSAVDALNSPWSARTNCQIACAVALHVGQVSYGNVGAADRLDFTVIGPAVNLVARMEQLARSIGVRIILSQHFGKCLGEPVVPLGSFALKGIRGDQPLFALR